MSTFRIIAFDPGGTTGWATYTAVRMLPPDLFEIDKGKYLPINDSMYEYFDEEFTGGQLGPEKHHDELDMLLGMQHVEDFTIVCESFEYRNRARAGLVLVSQQYIGVIERFAQERNVPLVMQSSSVGKITKKSFVRKENLEKLGLWVKGGASTWNHQMDSYGHLIQYMIKNGIRRDYLLEKGWK